ncbi:MAG: fatty acid hydroxylase family protein [Chitinophagales bacterium]|nr:fatty acid hydroxylase family protein [Chitinophagales bacterium]
MKAVEQYRNQYRQNFIGKNYNGYAHVLFVVFWCVAVIVFCVLNIHQTTWKELLIIPFTFIYINWIEYIGHKGPMHHQTKLLSKVFERHTMQHHHFFTYDNMSFDSTKDFKAVLFPPVLLIFFFVCFVLPVSLLIFWLWNTNAALIFMATIIAYYFNYEFLHFCYHLPENHFLLKIPLVKRLKKLHHTHHDTTLMTKYNFNISYPIFDWIYGTIYKK